MSVSLKKIAAWGAKLGELAFFPSFCKLCHSPLEAPGERILCSPCLSKLQPYRASCCLCCGRFFEGVAEPHLCSSCLAERPPFSIHRSFGLYRNELKDFILLFKYRGFSILGRPLGRIILDSLGRNESLWWGVEAIIPVPLHPRRKRERGFNQAQALAEQISKLKGIPLETRVLKKSVNVPPQTSLEKQERLRNVRGAYRISRQERIRGKTVLLIDDVYTTGSTLKECSRELIQSGAKEVRALTVAQA